MQHLGGGMNDNEVAMRIVAALMHGRRPTVENADLAVRLYRRILAGLREFQPVELKRPEELGPGH